ncbi:MAG: hypothetical protein A2V87_03720 [Deltaproteobacteria bacterium RBG_16_58_17]|nr:MAG: hypothetical protein A2V87_03720 [Deltaproteobacteria bacterium RBG_16_58_17]OHE18222.1 MAG: hypothetical protein A2X96_04305 [Syntrophobacterales bacterium GWC2_56_13]
MVQKDRCWLLLCVFILVALSAVYPAFAEIKVFEKETKWCASKDQSQAQAEKLAVLEAQQQAIEEAGVYISSLTVVKDFKLEKDEITKLASAILQTRTMGTSALSIENNTYCVRVRTIIQVDTSTLNPQIEAFMKDKGAQKKADEDAKTIRELREQMANLKSSDVKRLEELNTQALALERDRDRQRLFREEQALKAKGELSWAEADRIAKEREMSERINRTLAEQEKAKREEAAALTAEQDRIKRAQLENEQRWNDLVRKAQLTQDQWVVIDDSLSLRQAVTEVNDLKQEIKNLKGRLDYQYGENTKNLEAAYAQQRALTTAKLPPAQVPKDAFETTTAYNERISTYERQVKEAEMEKGEAVENLKKEENLKLAQAKVAYLGQQIRVLAPFIKRLQDLQDRKFTLPEGGAMTVDLGEPDADNNRFPVRLQHSGKSWSKYWDYKDINIAKDFYRTRTYLKAEGLFQIEEAAKLIPRLTAVRVIHPGTKETREFRLETPRIFSEIDQFTKFQQEEATAKEASKKAVKMLTLKEIGKDGRFTAYDDGTVLDTRTNLMWAAKDNGSGINWANAKSNCENYRGGGYTDWRMPTQDELAGLYDAKKKNRHGYRVTALIEISDCCPWASETRGSDAATFNFLSGLRHWLPQSYASNNRALPVRSGK